MGAPVLWYNNIDYVMADMCGDVSDIGIRGMACVL